MNSCAAICGLEAPSPARRAISASCAVRVSGVSIVCCRGCPPAARSSMRARPANAAAPIESKIWYALPSWSRASRRRRWRRSHSPYSGRALARPLRRGQRLLIAAQAVVQHRGRPLNDAQSFTLTPTPHVLGGGLDQLSSLGFLAAEDGQG